MTKILVIVPPLTGHINPLLAVTSELQLGGARIAWAGHKAFLDQHLSQCSEVFYLPEIDQSYIAEHSQRVRGLESIKFFYEHFLFPMAEACTHILEEIVNHYKPDIVVCDHQMIAGAVVARKLGVPWFSSITTSASIINNESVFDQWLEEKLQNYQVQFGVDPVRKRPDFSPYGCLVFSSEALIGSDKLYFEAPYHFVGPAISQKRKPIKFPWLELENKKKKVFVSLGTVSRDRSYRFYQVVMEALGGGDLQVIMVAPDDLEMPIPENFIVRERVPQLQILPVVDVVVSHAGHNTVCESLMNGKPMVLAPIRDDQPIIAKQVIEAGAGVGVRFGKVTVKAMQAAINDVISESKYKQSAKIIQQSFQSLGGEKQAASIIEAFVGSALERADGCR